MAINEAHIKELLKNGVNKKLLWTVVGKFSNIKKVVGNSAHYLTDLGVVKIGVGKAVQMSVGIPPHIGLNFCSHNMTDICHIVISGRVDNSQNKI